MKKVSEIFNSTAGIFGVVIPVVSAFWYYVPPLFPEIGYVIAILSVAVIYSGNNIELGPDTAQKSLKLGMLFIGIGIVLITFYVIFFRANTVSDPATGKMSYQIGFRKAGFSLTDAGKVIKKKLRQCNVEAMDGKGGGI